MKKIKWDGQIIYYVDKNALKFHKKIENKDYKVVKILKKDNRSEVLLVKIEEKLYCYKRPIEKNTRKWQRFLSIFRESESKREFQNILKIKKFGFNGSTPIIACEVKKYGVSIDSYLLYSYIDGRESVVDDEKLIMKELRKIHAKGFLHGDSQLMNFLISGNTVYMIDTKLIRNIYGKFGEVYEFIYLEESCYRDLDYDKTTFYYKVAILLKKYLRWLGKFKKTLRKKINFR